MHPSSSRPTAFLLEAAIFHARKLATKLANDPKVISAITLGIGLRTFEMAQPAETPTTAGHPNSIDKGIKASATRTCVSSKLIGAKNTTKTA